MLARVAEIFVERVECPPQPQLTAAGKLLVVDATATLLASGPLFARAGERFPLAVDVVALGEFAAERFSQGNYDELWLLVDAGSDLAYCQLLRGDLRGGGRRVELVCVGEVDGLSQERRLEPRHLGRGSHWRRRRDVAEGVSLVRALFAGRAQELLA